MGKISISVIGIFAIVLDENLDCKWGSYRKKMRQAELK
jgi:hypothetical protein